MLETEASENPKWSPLKWLQYVVVVVGTLILEGEVGLAMTR